MVYVNVSVNYEVVEVTGAKMLFIDGMYISDTFIIGTNRIAIQLSKYSVSVLDQLSIEYAEG